MINTTSTSAYLNVSNCALFNVSITVYTDQYVSQKNYQTYFDSGSKYNSYKDVLNIHLDYTVDIVEHTVTFNQGTNTVNINLTNSVHIKCIMVLLYFTR